MKYLLFLLLLISSVTYSQSNVDFRGDSARFYKIGGSMEVVIRNSTKDSTNGVLTNIGNGVTRFLKFRVSNDSLFLGNTFIGLIGGGGDSTFLNFDLPPAYVIVDGDTTDVNVRQWVLDYLTDSLPNDTISLHKKAYDSIALVINGDTGQYVYTGPGQFIQGQIPFAGSFGELRGSSNFTRDSTKGKILINPNFTATANLEAGVSIGGDYTMRTNSGDSAYGLKVSTLFRPRSQNKYMHSISADIRFDTSGVGATNTGIIPKAYSAFFNATEIFSVGLTSTLSTGSPELLLKGTAGNTFYINGSANFQLGTSTNHSIDWRSNNLTRGRLFNNGRWRFGDNTARGSTVSISGGTTSQPPFLIDSGALVVGTKIQNSFEYDGFRLYHVNRDTVIGDINITRTLSSSAGTLSISDTYSFYVFTGTTTTWTLPAVTGRTNRKIEIKNRGTGNITLNTNAGGNDIFHVNAASTFTISPGEFYTFICDGTYWELQNVPVTGWESYTDTLYTSASPFTITQGVTDTIDNRGHTKLATQKPLGVDSLYNRTARRIEPDKDGDAYNIQIIFKAKNSANPGYMTYGLDIGGTFGQIFKKTLTFPKGAAVEHDFEINTSGYAAATFLANGGLPKLTADLGDLEIYGIQYIITRTHKSR